MLRFFLKLFLLIAFLFPCVTAFTQEKLIDNAGLLNPRQITALNNRINSISDLYNFDLVIVTDLSIGNAEPMDYADDFFDYNGYGYGQNRDGCLLLHVTGMRYFHISTSGKGIKVLNSFAYDKIESDLVKYLSAENNYEAYNVFLNNWEEILMLDKSGRSYNFFYKWNIVLVIIAWVIAAVIGLIVVAAWKSGMNTAIAKTQAAAYVVPGSLNFSVKSDSFLYSTVTKTPRPTSNSSGGRGGTHTSSSGRTHGGGGRRY